MTQTMKVYNFIEANPGATTKALSSIVSSKKELAAILNGLIAGGYVLPQLNNRFTMQFFAVKPFAQDNDTVEEQEVETLAQKNDTTVKQEVVTDSDKEEFRVTFEKLEKHGKFVPIFDLRKALNSWSREKLDEVLRTLHKENRIQMHRAVKCMMNDE